METVLPSPWFSRAEREEVCHQLFSTNIDDRMQALAHIDVWKARSFPRIPLGIEVTAALVHALACETNRLSIDHPHFEEKDVEAAFCMALIRFINLITEVGQVMSHQLSISIIAQKMGVPEWIVDLRHSATHSNLPSLDVLRAAATWSLEWVKVNYWEMEEGVLDDFVPCPAKDDIRRILADLYKELITVKETSERKSVSKSFDIKKKRLLKNMSWEEFSQELVCSGFLFPTCQQTDCSEWGKESEMTIIKKELQVWDPLLNYLHSLGVIPSIVHALIEEGSNRPSTKGKMAALWIYFLLKRFPIKGKKQSLRKSTRQSLYKKMLKLSYEHLQIIGGFLPKKKLEQLLALTQFKAAHHLTGSRKLDKGYATTDGIGAERRRHPQLYQHSHCPLGVLPSQYGMRMLDLQLPLHANHICYRRSAPSNIEQNTTQKTEQHIPHLL